MVPILYLAIAPGAMSSRPVVRVHGEPVAVSPQQAALYMAADVELKKFYKRLLANARR